MAGRLFAIKFLNGICRGHVWQNDRMGLKGTSLCYFPLWVDASKCNWLCIIPGASVFVSKIFLSAFLFLLLNNIHFSGTSCNILSLLCDKSPSFMGEIGNKLT